jgi:hypothetical protein
VPREANKLICLFPFMYKELSRYFFIPIWEWDVRETTPARPGMGEGQNVPGTQFCFFQCRA